MKNNLQHNDHASKNGYGNAMDSVTDHFSVKDNLKMSLVGLEF